MPFSAGLLCSSCLLTRGFGTRQAYIASDSESEDEAAREATRNSYRALIDDLKAEHEQEDETPEMEITFDVGLKEASEQLLKRRQGVCLCNDVMLRVCAHSVFI